MKYNKTTMKQFILFCCSICEHHATKYDFSPTFCLLGVLRILLYSFVAYSFAFLFAKLGLVGSCCVTVGAFFSKPDQVWPARVVSESFFYCFRNKSFTFLIVPEQPVSIQNHSGSIVRKPSVAGEMSGVSQSDVLFTIDGFQASWKMYQLI